MGVTVASDTGNGTRNGTSGAICNARAIVTELTLSLLGLAIGVLPGTRSLEVLWLNSLVPVRIKGASFVMLKKIVAGREVTYLRANKSTKCLLCRTDGLVP